MATTLANLSAEVLGLVLDLVDAAVLVRIVLSGSTVLNNKLFSSVTRFEHAIERTKPRFFWPKIASRFRALTHFSLAHSQLTEHYECLIVHDVDLLALPTTLRSLELNFTNGPLCLFETVTPASDEWLYKPRLRPDLKDHFKNLVHLTWSPDMLTEDECWDFSEFCYDLCAWPLALDPWPSCLHEIDAYECEDLPPTTISLAIDFFNFEEETFEKLPPNLRHLKTIPAGDQHELFKQLPRNLERLVLGKGSNRKNILRIRLPVISALNQLTSLYFSPPRCDSELLTAIPRSLTDLSVETDRLEIECLAYFPPDLTRLSVNYQGRIYSSTSNSSLELLDGWESAYDGLPDSFISSMRGIVAKFPKKLKSLSAEVFVLIRAKDWDLLQTDFLRELPGQVVDGLTLVPSHAPYMAHIPQNIEKARLLEGCTLEMFSGIGRYLTSLKLSLTASSLGISTSTSSVKLLDMIQMWNMAVFETISRRAPGLKELSLIVDYTFHLRHLATLTVPLEKLSVSGDQSAPPSDEAQQRSKPFEAEKIPCLRSLEELHLSHGAAELLSHAFPSSFYLCRDLKTLSVSGKIPNTWIPLLPANLCSLDACPEVLDVEVFRTLPRSLTRFYAQQTPISSNWTWNDICELPPQMRQLYLPPNDAYRIDTPNQPRNAYVDWDLPTITEQEAQLKDIFSTFQNDIKFVSGVREMAFLKYDSTTMELETLLEVEQRARDAAAAQQARLRQSAQEDHLPNRSTRKGKRNSNAR